MMKRFTMGLTRRCSAARNLPRDLSWYNFKLWAILRIDEMCRYGCLLSASHTNDSQNIFARRITKFWCTPFLLSRNWFPCAILSQRIYYTTEHTYRILIELSPRRVVIYIVRCSLEFKSFEAILQFQTLSTIIFRIYCRKRWLTDTSILFLSDDVRLTREETKKDGLKMGCLKRGRRRVTRNEYFWRDATRFA